MGEYVSVAYECDSVLVAQPLVVSSATPPNKSERSTTAGVDRGLCKVNTSIMYKSSTKVTYAMTIDCII